MNNNPIRKMHVGWSYSYGGMQKSSPRSVREWVAICPKCNVMQRTKPYGYYYNTKNTRKAAKDALRYHLKYSH